MTTFEAYHGVTGAQHQTNFNRLSAQGYKMISLSVYGDPGSPLYAAVWVQKPSPLWVAVHGVDAAGYQSFFNTWTAKGYVPSIVSATGLVTNAVFAAVFEQGFSGAWFAHHGMTSGPDTDLSSFQAQNKVATSQKMILRSFAIYGSLTDRRYAAVWYANPGFVKWHVHPADTAANYQTTFNAETQLPGYGLAGYRPAYVTLSGDQFYCSVFKDDVVGPWVARHGMSASDYQTEFDKQKANGFYPICVQGGGSGDQTRYAAIFAQRDIPLSRQWAATGTEVSTLAGLDNIMQNFMQVNAVRTAQLTVGKNGTIKFSRAYSWAEPGYRVTQPSDVFLLASCSKIFTTAAIQSLINAGKLSLTDKAYPKLGGFSNPADTRSDTITIDQLLNHTGGYDDSSTGSGFDPTYSMRQIGLGLSPQHSVSKLDICHYMYARKLDFDPGTESHYSNYGYLLLSALVENASGVDFFQYVNTTLLQPAGISEVILSSTLASKRASNEAICEDEGLGLSPIDLISSLLIPYVYGGDGQIKEVAAGCAGIAASSSALVQFISNHAVWWTDASNGARTPGYARSGSTPGTSTWAESRTDGIDFAFVINTRDWPPQSPSPNITELPKLIDSLLNNVSL